MNLNEETNRKIEELQLLEQHTQHLLAQKQSLQIELNEANNALEELNKTEGEVYKVVSGIMLKSDKDTVKKELTEKKKELEMKIGSVDKQSQLLGKKEEELRKELNKIIADGNDRVSDKKK